MLPAFGAKDYPARSYAAEPIPPSSGVAALLLEMIGDRKKVLDIGCAEGSLARSLAARQCDTVGLDVSPAALESARSYCTKTILADLDAVTLSSAVGAQFFDAIVFANVLEYLRYPMRALDDARTLLLDGGSVVASVPNNAHGSIRLAMLSGQFDVQNAAQVDGSYARPLTARAIDELFLNSGYRIERLERIVVPVFHTSEDLPHVRREDYPAALIAEVEADPESTTAQFVVKAYPLSNEAKYRAIGKRFLQVSTELAGTGVALRARDREIEALRLELVQHDEALAKAQDDLQDLRTRPADASVAHENADLKDRVAELLASNAHLTKAVEARAASVDAYLKKTHELELDLVRLQERLRSAQNARSNANSSELRHLQAELTQRTKELTEAKSRETLLAETMTAEALHRAELELRLADLAKEQEALTTAVHAKEVELDRLRAENSALSVRITEADLAAASAIIRVEELSSQQETLLAHLATSEAALRQSASDIELAIEGSEEMERRLNQLSSLYSSQLREQIERTREETRSIAERIDLVQGGRLWRWKRFFRKALGHRGAL